MSAARLHVSNARRIIFTALALAAFWVLAYRAYWMGCDEVYEDPGYGTRFFARIRWTGWWLIWAFSLAVVPASFLSLSRSNSLVGRRDRDPRQSAGAFSLSNNNSLLGRHDRYLYLSAGALVAAFAASYWMGASDAEARPLPHRVSWLRLLLPIILTTAFVIFGAWRSAVRDADVEAVGEDE